MNFRRRAGLAGAFALCLVALPAMAQDYPARDIRAICVFPPNTNADAMVRFYADKLSTLAGKPVTVENKGGAAGTEGRRHRRRGAGGQEQAGDPERLRGRARGMKPVVTLAKGFVVRRRVGIEELGI